MKPARFSALQLFLKRRYCCGVQIFLCLPAPGNKGPLLLQSMLGIPLQERRNPLHLSLARRVNCLPHNPCAWLSGVIYLQVQNLSNQEEGSIELSLWGRNYLMLNKSHPKRRYHPKNGHIILFPSSLFYRTIPFHSNEERLCFAFDQVPSALSPRTKQLSM